MWCQGMLYSGCRKKSIIVTDTESMDMLRKIEMHSTPRAIDVIDDLMAVGTRDGTITEVNLTDESQTVLMQSHHTGEAWGLDVNDKYVVTSGDDDQVILWDPISRKPVASTIVNPEERGAKKNKAST